jgi:hypothetical protein
VPRYLPNYRYDVFLSYAHVDDKLASGNPPGWVTSFKQHIKIRLAQLLGRSDALEIFMDHDLKYADGITPQLMDVLEETAALLVILSPGYAASEWCRQ